MSTLSLALLLGALVASPPGAEPARLVESILKAYGGWPRLSKVSGYRATGTVVRHLGNVEGKTSRLLVLPDRLRLSLDYPDRQELRTLYKGRAFRGDGGVSLGEAPGPLRGSLLLQAARLRLPWILGWNRGRARVVESWEHDGRRHPGIELEVDDGLTLKVYADPRTHRIVRSVSLLRDPSLTIDFEARYDDFREVDGVLFPFREENYAGGRYTASTKIEELVLNPQAQDHLFLPTGSSL